MDCSIQTPKPPACRLSRQRTLAVPPADHHAERLALGADPPAGQKAFKVTRPITGSKRSRSDGGAALSDSAASDSDADPPRRNTAAAGSSAHSMADELSSAIPSADTSLFSPTITLAGGKAAAELPGPRAAAHKPRTRKSARGDMESSQRNSTPSATRASGPETPSRTSDALQGTNTPPTWARPPVCSPAKAASRRVLTFVASKQQESPQQQPLQQQPLQQQPVQQQPQADVNATTLSYHNGHDWGNENEIEDAHIDPHTRPSSGSEGLQNAMVNIIG